MRTEIRGERSEISRSLLSPALGKLEYVLRSDIVGLTIIEVCRLYWLRKL